MGLASPRLVLVSVVGYSPNRRSSMDIANCGHVARAYAYLDGSHEVGKEGPFNPTTGRWCAHG